MSVRMGDIGEEQETVEMEPLTESPAIPEPTPAEQPAETPELVPA